ncbi:hypothetical protein [Acinetobacter sp. ANC 3832]|uniref:hypothetical protein n=1 Tax=Acinetobacter sp. ANC 3832 TaxID=1977874 RepID=UPI000A356C6C|nr:hypothetical protein [Acinetobacter sp. ANC 3832]OTG93105.1 hypothetical protein B9T35_11275 [Acinetobacter sp. ANC 3832]
MRKKMLPILIGLLSFHVAAMEPLTDQDLQEVQGQAGADISLKLSLNQKNDGTFDNTLCSAVEFCRIGLSVNKRFVTMGAGDTNNIFTVANSDSGHKLWVVLKGIQGTIEIQKLGLDGIDLMYSKKGTATGEIVLKPAIQLSYTASSPIKIHNFGFSALSIEQDSFNSTSTLEGVGPTANDYGYLKKSVYSDITDVASGKVATASLYDRGKETGFTGLMMNGNLALNGKIMVFGCDGSHPRC